MITRQFSEIKVAQGEQLAENEKMSSRKMDILIAKGPLEKDVEIQMKHRDCTRKAFEDGKSALHAVEAEDAILSNKYRLAANDYKQSKQERDKVQQQIDNLTSEIKSLIETNETLHDEVNSNIDISKRQSAMQQDKTMILVKLKDKLENTESDSRLIKHSLDEVVDKNAFNLKDADILKANKEKLQNKKRALIFLNSQLQAQIDQAMIKDKTMIPKLEERNR